MNDLRQKIYLAGLLHDIGKFYQRTDVFDKKSVSYFKLLDPKFRALEPVYCPVYKGRYSHKHVLWTAQFIEKILGIEEKQYDADTVSNSLTLLAGKHHNPSGFYEKIITYADHLSSSMDRNRLTQDVKHEEDWGDYKKTPLLSVFEMVGHTNNQEWQYRLPVSILNVEKIMPEKKDQGYNMEDLYHRTWQQFETELKNTFKEPQEILTSKNAAETLYFLMQKYTVNVPSSTQDIPDVSLFDHSKTTAAFAVALFDFLEANKQTETKYLNRLKTDNNSKPFLLLGADLSGIQNYLYKIKSKFAAKNLKGRSFMLHLIMQTLAQKIIDELDLYQSNIIYNSGGTFFMLLPNTENTHHKLNEIKASLDKELMEKFGGDLYIGLNKVAFGMPEIFDRRLNEIWEEVFQGLNKDKAHRFHEQLSVNYEQYFEAFGDPEAQRDSITGEEIKGKTIEKEGMMLSALTWAQIELGKKLKKANYWYIIKDGWSDKETDMVFLGYHHLLREKPNPILDDLEPVIRYKINDTDFTLTQNKNIQAFEFYGGNKYPTDDTGDPKTFDLLTQGAYNKLGIVRMDVDNLGYIFKNGFTDNQKTFSRYASLSRNLDLFFKAYINHIWEKNPDYSRHTFIIYSGGDDLFIIGDWEVVLKLAEDIRHDFRKYVCYNPLFTLSGGELITSPKYPILKSAREAEEVEKAAKNYVYAKAQMDYRFEEPDNGQVKIVIKKLPKQKDAFSFLNSALGWESEYPVVKEMSYLLLQKINEGKLPKAFLQKIMHYYSRKDQARTYWLMSYDLGRMKKQYENEAVFIETVLKDILNNTWQGQNIDTFAYDAFTLYAIAARWAELLYRNINK